MRLFSAVLWLALGAGCTSLAGLDGEYVVEGDAGPGTGGAGGGSGGTTGGTGGSTGGTGGGSTGGGSTGGGGTGGTGSGTGGAGGGTGGVGGGTGGAGGGPLGFCDEPGLVACYRFEGNADDGSAQANHATTTAVQYGNGHSGQAISLDGNSLVTASPDPEWAPGNLTIEACLYPTQLPSSGRQGLVDHDGCWGLFVYDYGFRCVAGSSITGPLPPANTWTHVACTHDGTDTKLYVGGVEVVSATTTPLSTTSSTTPIHIGSNAPSGDAFIGQLDEIRVFDLARTQPQICAAAGGSGC